MVHRRRDLDSARQRHDSGADEDTYVHSRREDYSPWWRLTHGMEKYMGLLALLGSVAIAIGFGVVTPKRTVAELRGVVDTNAIIAARASQRLQAQLDSSNRLREELAHQHASLEDALTAVVRMQCIDPFVSLSQKQLAGVRDAAGNCIR